MLTAEIPTTGFPTLRIVFEPEDDGQSIGRILKAWDRPARAEEDGDAKWWPLSVRFAADRISRDGLQKEILAAAVERPELGESLGELTRRMGRDRREPDEVLGPPDSECEEFYGPCGVSRR